MDPSFLEMHPLIMVLTIAAGIGLLVLLVYVIKWIFQQIKDEIGNENSATRKAITDFNSAESVEGWGFLPNGTNKTTPLYNDVVLGRARSNRLVVIFSSLAIAVGQMLFFTWVKGPLMGALWLFMMGGMFFVLDRGFVNNPNKGFKAASTRVSVMFIASLGASIAFMMFALSPEIDAHIAKRDSNVLTALRTAERLKVNENFDQKRVAIIEQQDRHMLQNQSLAATQLKTAQSIGEAAIKAAESDVSLLQRRALAGDQRARRYLARAKDRRDAALGGAAGAASQLSSQQLSDLQGKQAKQAEALEALEEERLSALSAVDGMSRTALEEVHGDSPVPNGVLSRFTAMIEIIFANGYGVILLLVLLGSCLIIEFGMVIYKLTEPEEMLHYLDRAKNDYCADRGLTYFPTERRVRLYQEADASLKQLKRPEDNLDEEDDDDLDEEEDDDLDEEDAPFVKLPSFLQGRREGPR